MAEMTGQLTETWTETARQSVATGVEMAGQPVATGANMIRRTPIHSSKPKNNNRVFIHPIGRASKLFNVKYTMFASFIYNICNVL